MTYYSCRCCMVCCHKIFNCLNSTNFGKDIFKKILSLLFNFDFTLSISGFQREIFKFFNSSYA